MNVLLLSPYPGLVAPAVATTGDTAIASTDAPDLLDLTWADLIVSFGYRHIFKASTLAKLARPAINVHISFLPWNRGADPNFWSWFDRTPKGVTIHYIDVGIDTGAILAQQPIKFDDGETLATSYEKLIQHAVDLFSATWPMIREDRLSGQPQRSTGSYHRKADKYPFWNLLPLGYDTPVVEIEHLGSDRPRTI